MNVKHVDGRDKGSIMLYALSTCGWCRRTKALLGELGVAYDYIDVDLLLGKEQDDVIEEVKKYNPDCNFPTIVINGQQCIVGFKEDEIREALSK